MASGGFPVISSNNGWESFRTYLENASHTQHSAAGGLPAFSKCSHAIVYAGKHDFFVGRRLAVERDLLFLR
jgi:hypothetical protein